MTIETDTSHVAQLAADPLRFISLCWPSMQLYDKQEEVLRSVGQNMETFVHAANKTGKTRIAALVAIWFFASRTPARVILSSSSEGQLRNILWTEILQLIHASVVRLPFQIRDLAIRKFRASNTKDTLPTDYLLASVTNSVESFQGHHLPNDRPRVLAIFDEASAVPDDYYEAATSWAHRILVIGNPLSVDNFFYRKCKAGDQADPAGTGGLFRKVIRIDGLDVPNVMLGLRWRAEDRPGPPPILIPGLLTSEDFLRREASWDEVQRTTRLYGKFYEGDQALLFPEAWLDAASDRQGWQQLNALTRHAAAMGVDVAAGGRDKSCWTVIDQAGIIRQVVRDTPRTTEIGGLTIDLIRRYGLRAANVAMDAGGGGQQIADRLYEQGYGIQLVNFGEGPTSKQAYRNRRAEMYARLRERMDPGRSGNVFALRPDDYKLRQELAVLPLHYDSEGRLFLPPKDARHGIVAQRGPTIRQLLGRSPDRADSLVLAVWALGPYRPVPILDRPLLCYPCRRDPPPRGRRPNSVSEVLQKIIAMQRQRNEEDRF